MGLGMQYLGLICEVHHIADNTSISSKTHSHRESETRSSVSSIIASQRSGLQELCHIVKSGFLFHLKSG
jgi:hypothetical protein